MAKQKNTGLVFRYNYADGGAHECLVIMRGTFGPDEQALLAQTLRDGRYFIPAQVGLPVLCEVHEFTDVADFDSVSPWHELLLEETAETADEPRVSYSVAELIERFKKVDGGWDAETAATEFKRLLVADAAKCASENRVPEVLQATVATINAVIDDFCTRELNDEYRVLCRRLTLKLAKMEPSPLLRGTSRVWAGGIIYFIGQVNGLSEKGSVPHLLAEDLCRRFGVSPASASSRCSEIRRLTDTQRFDPEWCCPSQLGRNPLAWMVTASGLPLDARRLPHDVQERLVQQGLIPYVANADGSRAK